MAAPHLTPPSDAITPSTIQDAVTIKAAVLYLEPTGYPVTDKQLGHRLARAGVRRRKIKGTVYYSLSDILVVHRAIADQIDQDALRN